MHVGVEALLDPVTVAIKWQTRANKSRPMALLRVSQQQQPFM